MSFSYNLSLKDKEKNKSIQAPKPLLSKKRESSLSERQKEALNQLELLIQQDFPRLTMSEIAAKLKVSLRTLYAIAPSKEKLLLIAVDRLLFKIGREAQRAIKKEETPLNTLKTFLKETNKALDPTMLAFTKEFGELPGAKELVDSHEVFVMNITERLLEEAITNKEIINIDTSAMALILSGLGREIHKRSSEYPFNNGPLETNNAMIDVIMLGLENNN